MIRSGGARFSVVVCTRDRPKQLDATLSALARQSGPTPETLVIDQSDRPDPKLTRRAIDHEWLAVVRDRGRGLSRARNLGYRLTAGEWLVFLDDDCLPEPEWAAELGIAMLDRPDVALISGHTDENSDPGDEDYLTVTAFPVHRPALRSGRWTRPWEIGVGTCFAVRRSWVERLGAWDERLGPGCEDFPAADDMDFNYRLLRGGGVAYLTPRVRVLHDQWRPKDQLPGLYRGYMAAWAGFAMKHVRGGDLWGGLWLWSHGLRDAARMLASSARRRSRIRLTVALSKLRGLAEGTLKGLSRSW